MKKMILSILLVFPLALMSQTIVGKWKTIDDETGKAKSIVKIYMKDGKAYGKIVDLIDPDEPNPKCTECTDHRKDKPMIGMNIITGLTKEGDKWEGDKAILDPENGKIYDCKIWTEGSNKLKVRGYISFLYRTQVWYKAD